MYIEIIGFRNDHRKNENRSDMPLTHILSFSVFISIYLIPGMAETNETQSLSSSGSLYSRNLENIAVSFLKT